MGGEEIRKPEHQFKKVSWSTAREGSQAAPPAQIRRDELPTGDEGLAEPGRRPGSYIPIPFVCPGKAPFVCGGEKLFVSELPSLWRVRRP